MGCGGVLGRRFVGGGQLLVTVVLVELVDSMSNVGIDTEDETMDAPGDKLARLGAQTSKEASGLGTSSGHEECSALRSTGKFMAPVMAVGEEHVGIWVCG